MSSARACRGEGAAVLGTGKLKGDDVHEFASAASAVSPPAFDAAKHGTAARKLVT